MSQSCRYERKCSGCSHLRVPYAKQLRDKDKRVKEALGRFANPEAEVFQQIAPSPLPLGYRASTKLCLHMDDFGQRSIGLYVRDSKQVVDIPTCPVHHSGINKLVQTWFGPRATVPAPFYQHGKRSFQSGRCKFVTVRLSPVSGMAGVVLSHTGVDETELQAWARTLDTRQVSLYASLLSKADATRIIGAEVRHLAGPRQLRFNIGERVFNLDPLAFFQANFSLAGAFVDYVTEAGEMRGDILVDLYGGFGAYSYAAARGFARVYLVDGNSHAIRAAATQDEVPAQLRACAASVEDFLAVNKEFAKDAKRVTHVIANPPRTGLSSAVKTQLGGRRGLPQLSELTYVSCSLETLARDLSELLRWGQWRLASVKAFDMFPQTEHIEVVCKLKKLA